jgi:hypothetical protein
VPLDNDRESAMKAFTICTLTTSRRGNKYMVESLCAKVIHFGIDACAGEVYTLGILNLDGEANSQWHFRTSYLQAPRIPAGVGHMGAIPW